MAILGNICSHWNARYAIQWSCCDTLLKPQACYGDCHYLDESLICRFALGEGLVGQCFSQKRRILVPNVEHARKDFFRRASALSDGIFSVLFLCKEDNVLELGFGFSLTEEMACTVEALPEAYYESGADIKTSPVVASRQPMIPAFTPLAHRSAFLDQSGLGSYLIPDKRSEKQMPDSEPPLDRVVFDMAEVRQHSSVGDAWIVVHDNVYNITNFIKHHPGWYVGSQSATISSIMRNLGKDCTVEFDAVHPKYAVRQLTDYRIGEVAPAP